VGKRYHCSVGDSYHSSHRDAWRLYLPPHYIANEKPQPLILSKSTKNHNCSTFRTPRPASNARPSAPSISPVWIDHLLSLRPILNPAKAGFLVLWSPPIEKRYASKNPRRRVRRPVSAVDQALSKPPRGCTIPGTRSGTISVGEVPHSTRGFLRKSRAPKIIFSSTQGIDPFQSQHRELVFQP
jgi:hypothetical protein